MRSVSYLGDDANVCVESASDIVSVDFAVPVPSEAVFDGCRTDWILALRGVFVSSLPLLILGLSGRSVCIRDSSWRWFKMRWNGLT